MRATLAKGRMNGGALDAIASERDSGLGACKGVRGVLGVAAPKQS